MSEAYFRILEKHPEVKRVFQLGNHLVWVTPSGKALVIDASHGKEKLERRRHRRRCSRRRSKPEVIRSDSATRPGTSRRGVGSLSEHRCAIRVHPLTRAACRRPIPRSLACPAIT